ncbi:MAG: 50S ribosomal protein L1 [Candidatus Diapherotrites archaeon]|nr:50S ribosomal protein L1 [Candidatus Diapherotrites archaeon]
MRKEDVLNALKTLDEKSKKRNFTQTIELIINFRDLDVRKQENLIDVKVNMPHATGHEQAKALLFAKTVAFAEKVKDLFDKIIPEEKIPKLSKKEVQEILDYDVILAEGPVMLTVGKYLGQALAPRGKMPKPVNPNKEEVERILASMKSTMRITNRKGKGLPFVQVVVGNENMQAEQIAENILEVYDEVVRALPRQMQNIKSVYVKKTMSPAVKIV